MAKHKKGKKYKGYREDLAGGKIITDNGEIYFKQIYGYLLSLDELIIVGEVKNLIERTGKYPTIEKLVKTLPVQSFFVIKRQDVLFVTKPSGKALNNTKK